MADINPQEFGQLQAKVEGVETVINRQTKQIDDMNNNIIQMMRINQEGLNRVHKKLDDMNKKTHTPPCAPLAELKTQGRSIWGTLLIVVSIVCGSVGLIAAIIGML